MKFQSGKGLKKKFCAGADCEFPGESEERTGGRPFEEGQRYYAVIEALGRGSAIPARTGEIRLDILGANHISARTKIPWDFPIKVIWANFTRMMLN